MSGPVDVLEILRRTAAGLHSVAGDCKTDLGTPMRQAAEDVDQAATAVAELIEALEAIRDFRVELNAPVANSVKLRGIARAALANIGGTK